MKDYVRHIIELFTKGSYDKATVDEVHRWLADEDKSDQKMQALQQAWDACEGDTNIDVQPSLKSVYRKVGANRTLLNTSWFRYAAVFVLLMASVVSTYFLTMNFMDEDIRVVDNYTRSGEILNYTLPDGTKVQTNSETLLLYPEKFKGDRRTVFVLGEANFKVMPNPHMPFIVRSTNMDVTALGTEFNVSAYPENEEVRVTLLEGKVKVACGNRNQNYILYPGQQVAYNKNTNASKILSVDVDDVTAWQRGIIVFRSATLKQVFGELGRKFNVEFQFNETRYKKDKFNFKFSATASLTEILDIVCLVVDGLDYNLKDNVCVIK